MRRCRHGEVASSATSGGSDNHVHALCVFSTNHTLLVCSTRDQCDTYDLSNITRRVANSSHPVVPATADASVVMFFGPGWKPQLHNVMYVAAAYHNPQSMIVRLPSLTTRYLLGQRAFEVCWDAEQSTSKLEITMNSFIRKQFHIRYVYGVSHDGFSYFVTNQMAEADRSYAPFVTKLISLCQTDVHYNSYTEITLECRDQQGVAYNLLQAAHLARVGPHLANAMGLSGRERHVLFGVFTRTVSTVSEKLTRRSALCLFSIKGIRRKITKETIRCYRGEGTRGVSYFSQKRPCTKTRSEFYETITDHFCGDNVNMIIDGDAPHISVAVITYNDTLLTSVLATAVDNYTTVFAGTQRGHLKKIFIEQDIRNASSPGAYEYDDISIDEGMPIKKGMLFDYQKSHIYMISSNKVHKVVVQECHLYRTCKECLRANNPYCGWCASEIKCSVRQNCSRSASIGYPLNWVNYRSDMCTTISSVQPNQLQITVIRTLTLHIGNLPPIVRPDDNYYCTFLFAGLFRPIVTNATAAEDAPDTLICPSPRTDLLPAIPSGQHHISATLSVRLSRHGPDFVATSFSFYSCDSYRSCTACVQSRFPCDWCVDGNRCTHNTAEYCLRDMFVTGLSREGPSSRSGPSHCIRIAPLPEHHTNIMIADGTSYSIKVAAKSLLSGVYSSQIMCEFNVDGRVARVEARIVGARVICNQHRFDYASYKPNITVSFAVQWGKQKFFDNPHHIQIIVYNCSHMSTNCGDCLTLSAVYKCGWCQPHAFNSPHASSVLTSMVSGGGEVGGGVCTTRQFCHDDWLRDDQICPNPMILDFSPKSGPYEGGTLVNITGINLGKDYADIRNNVRINRMPCTTDPGLYVRSRMIVCKVDGYKTDVYREGPIVVHVRDRFTAESTAAYRFVDPRPHAIRPSRGPVAGGTRLHVCGSHMDAGTAVSVYLDDQRCPLVARNGTCVLCDTPRVEYPLLARVQITFDDAIRQLDAVQYRYVQDPRVDDVSSGSSPWRVAGIVGGGVRMRVTGANFGAIRRPQIYVRYEGRRYVSDCVYRDDTEIMCDSPAISSASIVKRLASNYPMKLPFGFLMDNVQSLVNLSDEREIDFHLYPNPEFSPFPEPDNIKYHKSDYLTINAQYLNLACKQSDVTVTVGAEPCNVTSLSATQLTCRPPLVPPLATDSVDGLPLVQVTIGKKLSYNIGHLYYSSLDDEADISEPVIIGVACAVLLLVFVVVWILIAYRRKSNESSRVLKNMQEQMDVLELRVAAECKEAFAELQTEMTDLTSDISGYGIPFLDYRTYCMKVLFPNDAGQHPVLQWAPCAELQRKEKGLRLFGQLVINRTFLLIFVRTLEANRYFSMQDRVNVASLLMVTLQSRMEYCTDILKTLLSDLIERCTESTSSHPKLLLRRTESIAEKMLSSWFTFLLYKFLRECAGEPLYLLYRAIKQQVEKGPVDAVTSEARYSLSEERLIRQQVEFCYLMIYVSLAGQTCVYDSGTYSSNHGPYQLPHHTGLPAHVPAATAATDRHHHLLQQPEYSAPAATTCEDVPLRVLNTDTISQVKEKCLDAIYRSLPYSMRPRLEDLDLEWRTGQSGRLTLYDEDASTCVSDGSWRRLNTLAHYNVPDRALFTLVPRNLSLYNLSLLSDRSDRSLLQQPQHSYETLSAQQLKYGHQVAFGKPGAAAMYTGANHQAHSHGANHSGSSSQFGAFVSPMLARRLECSSNSSSAVGGGGVSGQVWHLVRLNCGGNHGGVGGNSNTATTINSSSGLVSGSNFFSCHDTDFASSAVLNTRDTGKMVSEIYLTRLLATKVTLQKFVDDLFETIFSTSHRANTLPLAVKYMFDFLDDQALHYGILDPDTVHTWKSNSLPLRFWVNLIKNPNFIFDIHKSNILDSCLSVVAQTFMDSCSTSDNKLGKDSPSSKLLYAKDIPIYKEWVMKYYDDIRMMPAISDQDINAMLVEESRVHQQEFNTNRALNDLYMYAVRHSEQLIANLEEDEFSSRQRLALKLDQVHKIMSGDGNL